MAKSEKKSDKKAKVAPAKAVSKAQPVKAANKAEGLASKPVKSKGKLPVKAPSPPQDTSSDSSDSENEPIPSKVAAGNAESSDESTESSSSEEEQPKSTKAQPASVNGKQKQPSLTKKHKSSKEESSSEEESEESSEEEKPKAAQTKVDGAAKQPAAAAESDSSESSESSEEESSEEEKPKAAQVKSTPKRAPSVSSESSDESDDEEEKPLAKKAVPTTPAAAKSSPAKKAQKPSESSDSESQESESESGSESESSSDEEKAKKGEKTISKSAKRKVSSSESDESEDESSDDEDVEMADAAPKVSVGKRKAADAAPGPAKKVKLANGEAAATKHTSPGEGETKSIFVGRLSWSVDNDRLAQEFAECGEVVSATVQVDRNTGKSRGFGYVHFATSDAVEKALELNGKEIDGRAVNIDRSTQIDKGQAREKRAQTFGDVTSPPSSTLFVGNLSFGVTEDTVWGFFNEWGVKNVRLPTDRETGRPKGFGYVEFEDIEGAKKAFGAANGAEIEGRSIRLDFSQPRDGPGGGGGRNARGGGSRGRGGDRGGRGGDRGGRGGGRGGRGRGAPRGNQRFGGIAAFEGKKTTF